MQRLEENYLEKSIKDLTSLFSYASETEMKRVMKEAKMYASISFLETLVDGNISYDLRGSGHLLINTGSEFPSNKIISEEQAIKSITAVLKVEGVKEEYIIEDSKNILETLAELGKSEVKIGEMYYSRGIRNIFKRSVQQVYEKI